MTILESLTSEQLAQKLIDPQIQESIDFDLDLLIDENSPGSAYKAIKKLEPAIRLAKLSTGLQAKYLDLLMQLKFVALPKLKQEEASHLLSNYLLRAIKNGFNVGDKVHQMFTFADERDTNKIDWLLRSIESNDEVLGGNVILPDGKQYVGTVGNMIHLYKESVYFEDGGSLGISGFLANDKNVRTWDISSKELLRLVLSIYDWIRLKSIPKLGVNPSPIDFDIAPGKFSKVEEPVKAIPEKVATAFEKKLATISVQHGADLDILKKKMEEAAGSGPTGKVVEEVKKEVIEVKKQVDMPKPKPIENKAWNEEVKREVMMKELPNHSETLLPKASPKSQSQQNAEYRAPQTLRGQSSVKPEVSKPVTQIKSTRPMPRVIPEPIPNPPSIPQEPARPSRSSLLESLDGIRTVDDLKKIEPEHLRLGPTQNQAGIIREKVLEIIKAQKVLPYYAVLAFESSPLFKAYLAAGNAMVAGGKNSNLSQDEFEAIADLRRQIEQF